MRGAQMPALFLSENDVAELLDMETAIAAVEEAFRQLAEGRASNVPRTRAHAPGAYLHVMSASAEYLGLLGWKVYTTTKAGYRFHVGISSIATGELLALIEADLLGQFRTGAASGVATEYMARPDSKVVGVLGAGKQARTQLKAVCSVRNIEYVEVYSRNAERAQTFADEMCEWCNTKVVPVHTPDEVAAEKDIVICATSSPVPLFEGRLLEEGTHLNVIGSNFLNKTEIDVTTVRRADSIACDSVEACKNEAGDFTQAIEAGVIDWSHLHDLADVITGRQTGRAHAEHITLFKSVGLAIEDVAVAAKLLEMAKEEHLGQPLPF